MLSIGKMASGQADYYTNLAREDYYLRGGEPPGVWCGQGAELQGLAGRRVSKESLRNLCRGFSADGENALVQNAGNRDRVAGWDLTYSADKTVSCLWSCLTGDKRVAVQEAQAAAVAISLDYLQDVAAVTRRGKGGHSVEPAKLIVATFEHGTSRALDPQLHTHCLVMNACVRADGTTGTILSKPLYEHKMVAGALYRAELAAQLERRLGVQCEQTGTTFRIVGVPESLVEEFSKRRREVEERLKSKGLETAAAAATATLDTREAKGDVPPRSELFESWRATGRAHGFDPTRLLRTERAAHRDPERRAREALADALRALTAERSHFTEHELLQAVAVAAPGRGLGAASVRRAVAKAISANRDVISLGRDGGQERFTTPQVVELERRLLEDVHALSHRRYWTRSEDRAWYGVRDASVEAVLRRYGTPRSATAEALRHHATQLVQAVRKKKTERLDVAENRKRAAQTLSPEQASAVRHLTRDDLGRVRCLEGWAGTGKTATLRAVREAYEAEGHRVIGVALSGKAAKELRAGAGIESTTYAMLDCWMNPSSTYQLKHHARQLVRAARRKPSFTLDSFRVDRNTVLVVDEASMLSTEQLAKLAERVRRDGGMLLLVGDRRQLQAIGAGGGFAAVADRVGKAELSTIVRQRDERDRTVVRDLAEGRAGDALKDLFDRGRVTIAEDRAAALRRLVDDWATRERSRRDRALIFAQTNEEAREANQLCQEARVGAGELRPETSLDHQGTKFHVGERVLFVRRSRPLRVENGDTGTVTAVKHGLGPLKTKALAVRLDSGETVVVPLKTYEDLRLGYAVTTHKGQGTTVDAAYVMAGGRMQDREMAYVQASRARDAVWLYTDRHEADPQLKGLAKQMERSREKTLAEEVRRRAAEQLDREKREREQQQEELRAGL